MKYSIILPVRNGGHYLKECIRSILQQDFADFNLLVLDNCSTDGTTEWLQSLTDPRVHLFPSPEPLGIEANWNRIVGIRKNEYMTMIGHDDRLDKSYLTIMNNLVQRHPKATLYQAHFKYIDSKGKIIRRCKPMDEVQSTQEFIAFFLSGTIDTMGTGFMMKSVDYDRLGGIPPRYPNLLYADFELFINLTALGYKATAAEECFSFRLHQSMTTTSTDLKFQKAYEVFINFLSTLKERDSAIKDVVLRYSLDFVKGYGRGLSHRLLRTPVSKREGYTVDILLRKNKEFADRLVPGNDYDPNREFSVNLARRIDNNFVLRKMFGLFKKLYPSPLYK